MRRSLVNALALVATSWLLAVPHASAQDADPHAGHDMSAHEHGATGEVALFPAREASGTAWAPDDTPMYGLMRRAGAWEVMVHGHVVEQFLYEPGEKHRTGGIQNRQWSSTNWFMVDARRRAGQGRAGVRAMLTAEPWTVRDCGFINYLASGEMCQGDTIHDRQHAHDLFMELAATYDRPLRGTWRWQVYAALAGEPALGPTGFPHRLSAMPNPIAPIAHHWLDSTHISFGVVTAAASTTRWKVEASAFNGREPDENRKDLEFGALDSVAGRVSFLPTRQLALQVSAGHLTQAEAQELAQPRTDADKLTASATWHRQTASAVWASVLAYGLKSGTELVFRAPFKPTTHAGLFETSLTLRDRDVLFGRAEVVTKPAHELHAHEYGTRIFTVGKLEAGYVRYARARLGLMPGLGAVVSANLLPPELAPRYGGRIAPGLGVFASLRPARHAM